MEQWQGFKGKTWKEEVDVRDFIINNFSEYTGDESFLAGPTETTTQLWDQVMDLTKQEREAGGVLDMDTKVVSSITSHAAGYLNKEKEQIVGFQTEKPLKRSLMPFGGIRMSEQACEEAGYKVDPEVSMIFRDYRKTHNQGVFDAYTPEMRAARTTGVITGLPDAYGRGRIIGDYRRVALYGVDYLMQDKLKEFAKIGDGTMTEEIIRLREEFSEQYRALKELKELGNIWIRYFQTSHKR